jgi:hypothetical protein
VHVHVFPADSIVWRQSVVIETSVCQCRIASDIVCLVHNRFNIDHNQSSGDHIEGWRRQEPVQCCGMFTVVYATVSYLIYMIVVCLLIVVVGINRTRASYFHTCH